MRQGRGRLGTRRSTRARVARDLVASLSLRRKALGLAALSAVVMLLSAAVVSCQTTSSASSSVSPSLSAEPEIRVRIRTRAPNARLASVSAMEVRPAGGGVPVTLPSPLLVEVTPQGFEITDGEGLKRRWPPGVDLDLRAILARSSIVVDQTPCSGELQLRAKWREAARAFDIVSVLPMETYIAGVLQKELYDNWPQAAYEAQAIAARSYALHERDRARRAGRAYDVESSTLDQVYGGLPTRPLALEGARRTRGMVLTYEGAGGGGILRAYYSSSCGGRPSSARAIWPTAAGFEFNLAKPLQGAPREFACGSSPAFAWEVVRKNDELARRLRAWGRDAGKRLSTIDRIRSVAVAERNPADKPTAYTITDVRGWEYRITAEELRVACNFAVPGQGQSDSLPAISSGPTHVRSNDMEFTIVGNDVRIRGRGFGHAVGLCQFCAKGFADRGVDAPSMLRTFYPGATIERAY